MIKIVLDLSQGETLSLTSRAWVVKRRVTRALCQRGNPKASEISNSSCSKETTPLRFNNTVTWKDEKSETLDMNLFSNQEPYMNEDQRCTSVSHLSVQYLEPPQGALSIIRQHLSESVMVECYEYNYDIWKNLQTFLTVITCGANLLDLYK